MEEERAIGAWNVNLHPRYLVLCVVLASWRNFELWYIYLEAIALPDVQSGSNYWVFPAQEPSMLYSETKPSEIILLW